MRHDVVKTIKDLVSSYRWRHEKYISQINEIRNPLHAVGLDDYVQKECGMTQPERVTDRILELDKKLNSRIVHAIGLAKGLIIEKYGDVKGEKVFEAFIWNATDPYRYSHNILNNTMNLKICRTDFFDLRKEFFDVIADFLELK